MGIIIQPTNYEDSQQSLRLIEETKVSNLTKIKQLTQVTQPNEAFQWLKGPLNVGRVAELQAENKVLVKECKRLKEMTHNPVVIAQNNAKVYTLLYDQLKRKFQMKFENRIGTLYPGQVGYLAKYRKYKEKCSELEESNTRNSVIIETLQHQLLELQENRDQLISENLTLKDHICPHSVQTHSKPRILSVLFPEFWTHLLQENPSGLHSQHKKTILDYISASKGTSSHTNIQTGFMRLGFYISHAEAMDVVKVSSGTEESVQEEAVIPSEAVLQTLSQYQPYPLWEDVLEVLTYLRCRFACKNKTENDIKAYIEKDTRMMDRDRIKKKIAGKTFKLKSCSEELAKFILRREALLSPSQVFERLKAALGPWKSMLDLSKTCQSAVSELIFGDFRLKNHFEGLLSSQPELSMATFKSICTAHFHDIDSDVELYIQCVNLEKGIVGKVSIKVMLESVCAEHIKETQISAYKADTDEETEETSRHPK